MCTLAILAYIIYALLLLCGVFMFLFYDWSWVKERRRYGKIPGPKLQFIVGAGLELLRCKEEELFPYLQTKQKEVGSDLFLGHILGRPNVFLYSARDIEVLFRSYEYITKGYEYSFMKPWFRDGLITSGGEKWMARKKMLMPAYHNVVLQNYIPAFNKHAKALTKLLADESQQKGKLDIESYLVRSTLDIIMDTMMGLQLNCLHGKAPAYVTAIARAGDIVLKRVYTFWLQNDMIFNLSPTGRDFKRATKEIHGFCMKAIIERKKTFFKDEASESNSTVETMKHRKSFLDYLLVLQRENPTELTDDDLIDELQAVLNGGNESVSVALTWILFMLATHPDVQQELRREIDDVFGGSDRDVTLEDINQLNYMEMVISETLRLYPVFPFLSRWLLTDLKLEKYTIPAKTNVIVVPYIIHRNPDVFPDPEKFDPMRFSPEAIQERHKYSFLAWSAGYRNCVGKKFASWELKTILATIFRKLTVSTHLKCEDVKINPQLVSRPSPHIYVTFEPVPS